MAPPRLLPVPASPLTPRKLYNYSGEHVVYEVDMLFCAILIRGVKAEPPEFAPFLVNARLEAFASHLRNVISFLYPHSGGPETEGVGPQRAQRRDRGETGTVQ